MAATTLCYESSILPTIQPRKCRESSTRRADLRLNSQWMRNLQSSQGLGKTIAMAARIRHSHLVMASITSTTPVGIKQSWKGTYCLRLVTTSVICTNAGLCFRISRDFAIPRKQQLCACMMEPGVFSLSSRKTANRRSAWRRRLSSMGRGHSARRHLTLARRCGTVGI